MVYASCLTPPGVVVSEFFFFLEIVQVDPHIFIILVCRRVPRFRALLITKDGSEQHGEAVKLELVIAQYF